MSASAHLINDFLSTPAVPAAQGGTEQPARDTAFRDLMDAGERPSEPAASKPPASDETGADRPAPKAEKPAQDTGTGADSGPQDKSEAAPEDAAEETGEIHGPAQPDVDMPAHSEAAMAPLLPVAAQAPAAPAAAVTQTPANTAAATDKRPLAPAPAVAAGNGISAAETGTDLPRTGKALPPDTDPLAPTPVNTPARPGRDGGPVKPAAEAVAPVRAAAVTTPADSITGTAPVAETLDDKVAVSDQPAPQANPLVKQGRAPVQLPLAGPGPDAGADTEIAALKETPLIAAAKPVQQPAVQQYQATGERTALMQTGVDTPVADPKWRGVVQERVLWLASQNISAAEIHLDPPELGPLQVKITLSQEQGQAQVAFSSQHASVREALDLGSHRLRELFEGQGLDLVDVDVSDQSFAGQSESETDAGSDAAGAAIEEGEPATRVTPIDTTRGLVDHYV